MPLLFKCSLYNDLRNGWIRNITKKTPGFVELDTTNKFKVIFDDHLRITAKILQCKKGKSIQIMIYMLDFFKVAPRLNLNVRPQGIIKPKMVLVSSVVTIGPISVAKPPHYDNECHFCLNVVCTMI